MEVKRYKKLDKGPFHQHNIKYMRLHYRGSITCISGGRSKTHDVYFTEHLIHVVGRQGFHNYPRNMPFDKLMDADPMHLFIVSEWGS